MTDTYMPRVVKFAGVQTDVLCPDSNHQLAVESTQVDD
jgi:hypothetical protein